MATPVGDSYAVASGGVIAAGRNFLPSWIPAPGQLKSVHLNSLSSINPCPGDACWYSGSAKQNGPWVNWTGAVFSPDYSPLGAMVYWGGGHGGYDGTEYSIFDLTTRSWSRVGAQIPEVFTPDSTWYDVLVDGSYVVQSLHTYNHPLYISPTNGGGSKGSWFLGYNVGGSGSNIQPHAVDLATGISTRFTTAPSSVYLAAGPYGGAFIDTNRNVVWLMPGQDSNQNAKIDLNNSTKTLELVSSFLNPGYYFNPVFVPEKDMMIAIWCGYGETNIQLAGFDLSSGTPVRFAITQGSARTAEHGPGLGMDWCPHTGKFYAYEGFGDTSLHVLTPPANWKTGTWSWSSEAMTGELPADAGEYSGMSEWSGQQVFNKFRYNQKLRSFMWSQGTVSRQCTDGIARDGAFQLYRPIGT